MQEFWKKLIAVIVGFVQALFKKPAVTLPTPIEEKPKEVNPMEGFASFPFDRAKLKKYVVDCQAAGVKYDFGGKDPTPKSAYPIDYKGIDCSGWARVVVNLCTGGKLMLTDGSVNQNGQLSKLKFEDKPVKVSSHDALKLKDNRVRIAFWDPTPSHAGHVWLVLNGVTYESHGGKGPDTRDWSSLPVASKVYVLSDA